MTATNEPLAQALTAAEAWDTIRAAVRHRAAPGCFALDARRGLVPVAEGNPHAVLAWREGRGWGAVAGCAEPARRLMALYLPLCGTPGPLTVAQLGQSVDGCIATAGGDSYYVTGRESIVHLHRLRALSDAVLVGAGTVAVDDPRLTTRLVAGRSPTRVVLDPARRLPASHAVFDAAAPALLACDAALAARPATHGRAAVLGIPAAGGRLDLAALLAALHARGLRRVLVEGGGVTVSRFLDAGLVDRLHLAVAPLMVGAGRRGLHGAPRERLADCPRPPCRIYSLGQDVLYDYDLRGEPSPPREPGDAIPVPVYPR